MGHNCFSIRHPTAEKTNEKMDKKVGKSDDAVQQ